MRIPDLLVATLVSFAAVASAQEVQFIDLTREPQRVALRFPPHVSSASGRGFGNRFVNTGRLPISIPVSPHLSDLQPPDPSVPFTYLDLGLVVRVRGDTGSNAYVRLYGANDQSGTIRELRPGEWIRIKANLKFDPQPPSCTSLELQPGFWMHSNRFHATSGYFGEAATGICVNEIPMPQPTETVVCEQVHDRP